MKSCFDQHNKKLYEFMEMRATEQRSASREQDGQQARLAIETDGTADEKTRERMEGVYIYYKCGIMLFLKGWRFD